MKKAIVTGCAGFIGSHLCDALLKKGFKVIGIDNFVTGKQANISHLKKNEFFEFHKRDIIKGFSVSGKIDYVFNLASPASPIDYQKIPIQTALANSIGTKNMLDLAIKKHAVFLEASTSEVYGDPLEHPQRETYNGNVNIIGPRACYDESKRFSEMLVSTYKRVYGLNSRIARIFNTYGPRMRSSDGRVIPNFITQALNNKPITVYGTGKQTRSFCYISDLVNGLLKLAFSNYSKPVNLGNPREIKIIDLAKKIKKMTNSKSKICFKKLPVDDPSKRKPDISIARKKLKWKPGIRIKKGLKKTIDYFSKKTISRS